jgi:hypothetical protein
MMFGLVAILVTLGVIIWFMHVYELPAIQTAVQTKKKVEDRFSMNTADGLEDAKASIAFDALGQDKNRLDGFLVKSIVPGGAMSATFGLMPGDTITAIGGQRLRDINDAEMAEAWLFEAKVRQWPLTVVRGGQEIQLPPH